MSTLSSRAGVATDKPGPYMRQLCKHFGHRNEASFDEHSGRIQFEYGACELRARERTLELVVSAEDEQSHERMQQVIGSHLERFGKRDGLSVSWG